MKEKKHFRIPLKVKRAFLVIVFTVLTVLSVYSSFRWLLKSVTVRSVDFTLYVGIILRLGSIIFIFSAKTKFERIADALFASLLLFNFISVSINYKKKDIGILRALGARKIDVFKVFFSESMLIISVCFTLSVIFSLILSLWFNAFLKENLMVSSSLFFFGPLQALILGALATAVAFVSTILPVHHHAKKPPVDAIRAL